MVEPKISLSLLVPGATMLSQQEAENKPKESYDYHKLSLKYEKGKGKNKKIVKEIIGFKTRKQRLITQTMVMSEEAYDAMIETAPTVKLSKIWKSLSIKERLSHHFDLIANDLGAISYDFEVLKN